MPNVFHLRRLPQFVIRACVLGLTVAASPNVIAQRAPVSPRLSPDDAVARAMNSLRPARFGYHLEHPTHDVAFRVGGITMTPRRGPAWAWRLESITAGERVVASGESSVQPTSGAALVVRYDRGAVIEQYVPRRRSVEQQFVIPDPLDLEGADLTIAGRVSSPGAFAEEPTGWVWRGPDGAVRLGTVTVIDAEGAVLPATMTVTAGETAIVVDGAALANAAHPVTVDPEIGPNDFRISDMGPDGDVAFGATVTPMEVPVAAVAYNSTANEYLVVWAGDDNTAPLVDDEMEIFGQRIDATTGAATGPNDFRISDMGPDGDANFDAGEPSVAYDPMSDQYLVVWSGDDNTAPLVDNEFEIFGQRLTGTGTEIGPNDFRVSDMGADGDVTRGAFHPDVAVLPTWLEYLVVWSGDDSTGLLVDDEFEIFAQRINAPSGAEIGTDFRISDMGPDGSANFAALSPHVAANTTLNEFLAVWSGDDDSGGLVDDEFEIFGQRVAFGAQVGQNDFRISDMGPDGNPNFGAPGADAVFNPTASEYLVVWWGDDNNVPLVDNEFEIFGQRITPTGGEIGTNDFRISGLGPDGDTSFAAGNPAVIWDATNNEYFVVWFGADNAGALVAAEAEVWGQRLTAAGAEVGPNDVRLSDMGTDGNALVDALVPAVAFGTTPGSSLVVWWGDDDTAPLVDEEFEVYGQLFSATVAPPPPPPAPDLPGAPANLTAVVTGFNVTLNWNASTLLFPPPDRATATSYRLEVGSASGQTDLTTIQVGNVTALQATGPAGRYFAAVRGVNAVGEGPRSNEVAIDLPGGGPPPCGAPPTAPTGLTVNVVGRDVTLNWVVSFDCAPTSYVIEAGSATGQADLAVLNTVDATTSFFNPNTPPGTYFVRVRGRNASGDSGTSNEVIVIVP